MPNQTSILRLFAEASPALTIGALLLLPVVLPNHIEITHTAELRQVGLLAAMEAVPYTIGPWIGTDVEVPADAGEMLHTTAILSRRYDRLPRGPMVSVMLVHCTDSRDMLGHYPPRCYPSSGWSKPDKYDEDGTPFELVAGDLTIPVTEYVYEYPLEHGQTARIRIFNFFILPDGTLSRNKDDIYKQSERLAVAVQGAAQMQVITSLDLPRDQALAEAGELLKGMEQLFQEFGVSGESEDG